VWSEAKADYCCQSEGLGCDAKNCNIYVPPWSPAKQDECCKEFDQNCDSYVCVGVEQSAWSPDKRNWCCTNEQVGCA